MRYISIALVYIIAGFFCPLLIITLASIISLSSLSAFFPPAKVISQTVPTLRVIHLALWTRQGVFRTFESEAGFKHKGKAALELAGLAAVRLDSSLVGVGIRPMGRHGIVQRCSSGDKTLAFGVVLAINQSHKFCHYVPMEPRWAEGVVVSCHDPGWNITKSASAVPGSSDWAVRTV